MLSLLIHFQCECICGVQEHAKYRHSPDMRTKYGFRPVLGICRGWACDAGLCKFVASSQAQLTAHTKHTHDREAEADRCHLQ